MSGKRGGKFSKPIRGGGKKFSRNLKPLEQEEQPGMWEMEPAKTNSGSEEEEEGEGDGQGNVTMTREERRAAEKARKEAAKARKAAAPTPSDDDDEEEDDDSALPSNSHLVPANPNAPGNASTGEMSRKEREAKEAAAAKERWQKLHLAGKTDEAKADLARLAVIRKEREEKARQKKAELEEKQAAAAARLEASGRRK